MLGVRRFEYVLPIGTWLTVVGEVSLPSLYSLLSYAYFELIFVCSFLCTTRP